MSTAQNPYDAIKTELTDRVIQESQVHFNLSQDWIIITEDKLKDSINCHLECLKEKDKWLTPLSLFITFIIVFCTSTFKDALGFPQATWEAVFLICTALSLVWTLRSGYKAITNKVSLDTLLNQIKKKAVPVDQKTEQGGAANPPPPSAPGDC